ncbi:MAG: hypothetical protein RIE74_02105 [Pseudomonadales bacterium]
MTGYTVGDPHPNGGKTERFSGKRQWHQITDAEIADLADHVVHAFAAQLRGLNVAGGDLAPTWEVAERIRTAILDHHAATRRRVDRA